LGWAAGGAIVGGTNAGLGGGDIVGGMIIGAASGLVGGALGSGLGPGIGKLVDGVTKSPALNGALSGALGGGIIGFGLGGISSLATGGDFWEGAWQGGASGFLTGGIAGGAAAAKQAHDLGFNPWTGNRTNSIAVQQLSPKGPNTSTSPPVQKPIAGTNRVGVRDPSVVGGDRKVNFGDFAGKSGSNKSGTYLLEFDNGNFYVGKGKLARMNVSIRQIERTYNVKLVRSRHVSMPTERSAFILEHKIMMNFGGPLSFNPRSPTYNKIFSPGKKLGGN